MALKEVKIEDLTFNPFTKIGKEWMLITAGNEEKHNTMTASWGGVGIMWGMNVATADIRKNLWMQRICIHFPSLKKSTEKH